MGSCRKASQATPSSPAGRRRRHATAAIAAAAVLCNAGATEAFVDTGPLHLNDISTSRTTGTGTMIGDVRSAIATGGHMSRLHAVTDPEVLLKDLFEQQSKVTPSKPMKRKKKATRANAKSRTRKDGEHETGGTMINMNMEDLYRLESSFGIDSTTIRRINEGEKKVKRSNINVEKLKQRSGSSTSSSRSRKKKSQTSKTTASIAPPLDKINASSTRKSKANGKKKTTIPNRNNNRSSTMPGFLNNKSSQRHQAFRDGLRIAKTSNTKQVAAKIHKALNSEEEVLKRKKSSSVAMYSGSASVPDSLIAFTNELHKETRITPKEEVEFGTKTQDAIEIQNIYCDLEQKLGREPNDGEWCAAAGKINIEALNAAVEEGREAKHRLVTSNLRMVQGVVNLYIRNGLGSQYNAGDLMQDGTAALIRAAEKFEPSRGFRFSTYAMYWIRAAVKRSQILQSRIINVPQRLHETHKKITKTECELKKELGRKPHKKELAVAVGITEVQLERCLKAMAQQCFSLDAELENTLNPNKGGNKETMYNILSAKYDNVEYKQIKSGFMKDDLVSTLKRYLTPHEVDLLLLRYGLMDERTMPYGFSGPLTIAEVSRLVGLKPDKVRRIINKCLRQLRHLIAHEWEDFERELA